MTLTASEFFSGIGGFSVGFHRAGIATTTLTEWDKHCQRVLAEHFPETKIMEDIKDVSGTDLPGGVDLMAGGFPCQDTSIAAPHRKGLAGARSGHFHEFTRLIGEYARVVDSGRPRWVVIENPSGLLRSNDGRDMATVVGTLAELGYGWAYRVVDGGHLGTPQRRPRVLVVGHRGGDPRPAWQVLGDTHAGSEVAAAHPVSGGPRRLRAVGGDPEQPVKVWRKSARARASLAKGGYETWVDDGRANTLTGFDGGLATRQTHLIRQGGRLRTLTLTEWERLQGFPDGWTAMVADGERYQQLGNAIHTGTAEWLGRRIKAVHEALPLLQEMTA